MSSPVAIVTGASAGIGLATAARLIAAGWRVVLVARTASTLEREAARLGPNAVPWPLDVGDLPALAALPAAVVERLGRLDLVVNNAGAHRRGPALGHDALALAEMVTVNLSAPVALTRAAIPLLPDGGCVVNVASIAGKMPLPDASAYSATKVGLRFFTLALAQELPRLRISVVSPGPVFTDFILSDLDRMTDLSLSQPMSTADEIAAAILSCLDRPSCEIDIPASSGRLATVGYLMPWVRRLLRPALEARGRRNRARYKAQLAAREN